ncbi:MAG: hypothetical protein IJD65_00880 [Mailhella sp.]|nr:hypothetical protein [Mailhella sp.]
MRSQRQFPTSPFILGLIGLSFCLWVQFSGGTALCLTDGCALFQDFSLAGVSLWTAGSAFFGLTLALCALRLPNAARLLSGTALAADILLMAVMSFTAPCANCLIVGLLIALTFFSLLRETALHKRARRSLLLLAWALLFTVNAGGILRDASELWSPLPRPEQTSVQVFFSPSCRACQTLAGRSSSLPDAAWFPVAEDSRDIWLIRAMAKRIAEGQTLADAIAGAHTDIPGLADAPDLMELPDYRFGLLKPEMILLQFRLWKNRAHVLAAGSDRLPFVEFRGLPAFLREEARPSAPRREDSPRPEHAEVPGLDLGVAAFCGGEKQPGSCEDDNSVKNSPRQPSALIDTSGMAQ